MSTDTRYNGWTNYETWCLALWQDNDQGSYNYVRELAEDHAESDTPTADLADALKEMYEDANPLAGEASVWSDMLSAALGAVDWHEIAENLLEEIKD